MLQESHENFLSCAKLSPTTGKTLFGFNTKMLAVITDMIVQKLENNEARPKFTGSYFLKKRVVWYVATNEVAVLTSYSCISLGQTKKYVCFQLPTVPKFRSPTLIFLLSFLVFYN